MREWHVARFGGDRFEGGGEYWMNKRAEYSWLALLLVAAIGAILDARTGGPQDVDQQQIHKAPDGIQQIVMRSSRGDRLGQASPSGDGARLSESDGTKARAVDKTDADGLYALGLAFLNGTGVERDLAAAFEFLSSAAQAGDASAMAHLGTMYERGWGTEPNQQRALELYAKAAERGNRLASDNLQRLRAVKSEAGTESAARPIKTPMDGTFESSSPREPNSIPVTAQDATEPKSRIQAVKPQSSPDAGWSTSAIPLAPLATASSPEQKRKAKAETLRRQTARPKSSRSLSLNDISLQESNTVPQQDRSPSPGGSKILAKGGAQKNKVARPSPRSGPASNVIMSFGSVNPAGTLFRETCAQGNWVGSRRC
jgi:TPR repeat protein